MDNQTDRSTSPSRIDAFDEQFMSFCLLAAQHSKDPDTQVGACVVDREENLLGWGCNNMPGNCPDGTFPWGKKSKNPLENKFLYVCHAELNAICNAKETLKDCKIYVTLFPCNECAKLIIQKGITEVVYLSDEDAGKDFNTASKTMLKKTGVKYRQFKPKRNLLTDFNKSDIKFVDIKDRTIHDSV